MKAAPERANELDTQPAARAASGPEAQRPSPVSTRGPLNGRNVLQLQRRAGNAAVAAMLARQRTAQRAPAASKAAGASLSTAPAQTVEAKGGGVESEAAPVELEAPVQRKAVADCPAPPVEPTPPDPKSDPKFTSVEKGLTKAGKEVKKHPKPADEAKKAQDAAKAPPDDKESQAKANQAEKMGAAKPKGFDKAGFIAAVKKAIAAKAPKNLDEADKFADSGKAEQVKGEVLGKVSDGKKTSAEDIDAKTKETPDTSKAKEKPVVPMKDTGAGPKPAAPKGGAAMPAKAPSEQTNLAAGPCEVDSQMEKEGVTEEQLKKSNEPEFQQALDAKKAGEAHAAKAPGEVRKAEAQVLKQAEGGADGTAQKQIGVMFDARGRIMKAVAAKKTGTQSQDEQERAKVSAHIKGIFDRTKTDVEKILTDLDGKVSSQFESGEARARAAFTADHKRRMKEYTDRRYAGASGKLQWFEDLFKGLPPEANNLFLESRKLYEAQMEKVISDVADTVGNELTRAKNRIAQGRTEIEKYVGSLPKNLQKFGKDAAKEVGDQFDDLEKDVDNKQESLVEDLAQKYVEARNKVDEEIKKLQEENKGWIDKAKDAVGGAIETIKKLRSMLEGALARAAGVVGRIIKDPIGFLSNLIAGVKGGIMAFKANIVTHLKKGLMGWLFGALGEAGIELPQTFDLKGIVQLIASILGLTWQNIRKRLVKAVGEPAVVILESSVEVFVTLAKDGPGGLYKMILDKVGDLKEMILSKVREFVIEKIIIAGITWLIGLLNPAAAFIKACKLIYDVVMFFVSNAARIATFVNTVLDSVAAIAAGQVGAVVTKVEQALGQMVPILIGFLASVLGLGGIGKKIRGIIETIQKPVKKAIGSVIKAGLKIGKKLLAKAKGLGARAKEKLGGKAAKVKARAKAEITKRTARPFKTLGDLKKEVDQVFAKFRPEGLKSLRMVPKKGSDGKYDIVAKASPAEKVDEAEVEAGGSLDVLTDQTLWEAQARRLNADAVDRKDAPVRLSKHSASFNEKVLAELLLKAPAPNSAVEGARRRAHAQLKAATAARKEDAIYRHLQNAARAVNDLYKKEVAGAEKKKSQGIGLPAHHQQQVADHPSTFSKTRAGRIYAATMQKIKGKKPAPGTPEGEIAKIPDSEMARKREIAKLYVQQKLDAQKDKKPELLEEIDIIIVTKAAHDAIHREDNRKRLEARTKAVPMAGSGHQLKFKPPRSLTIASAEGSVEQKIHKRLATVKGMPGADAEVSELQALLRQAKGASQVGKLQNAPDPNVALDQAMEALKASIAAYAAKYKVKDFDQKGEDPEILKLVTEYGMPYENFLKIQKVAARFNVVFDVRSTTKAAIKLLKNKTHKPKPEMIKAKTVKKEDTFIGPFTDDNIGEVGFFKPSPPQGGWKAVPAGIRESVRARFGERNSEYAADKPYMEKLQKAGLVSVVSGLVKDKTSGKGFTGDHDLFQIWDNPPPKELEERFGGLEDPEAVKKADAIKKKVEDALIAAGSGVMHGAHMDWKKKIHPEDVRKNQIFMTIVNQHKGGVGLLRIFPSGPPRPAAG